MVRGSFSRWQKSPRTHVDSSSVAYPLEIDANTLQTVPRDSLSRASRRSWQAANRARRILGRRKAVAMLAMKLSNVSAQEIADLFSDDAQQRVPQWPHLNVR
jgi:hypothetical protein